MACGLCAVAAANPNPNPNPSPNQARGSLTGAPIAVSSGVSLGGGAARAASAFSALFLERIQRLSTWPAMLPGPSKKDCDELAESTCLVKGGGVRTPRQWTGAQRWAGLP